MVGRIGIFTIMSIAHGSGRGVYYNVICRCGANHIASRSNLYGLKSCPKCRKPSDTRTIDDTIADSVEEKDGCLVWGGRMTSGSPRLFFRGSEIRVRSHVYGPTGGAVIRMTCCNPRCINVEHMSTTSAATDIPVGSRFGRVVTTAPPVRGRRRGPTVDVLCDCGSRATAEVSNLRKNLGCKRCLRGLLVDRLSKYTVRDGCHEWGNVDSAGYGRIFVNGRRVRAHRASWKAHRGPIPAGMHVLHSCDNPPCINPDHLFLGDHASNMKDKTEKGRAKSGPRLSEEKVALIRASGDLSITAIARLTGSSRRTISKYLLTP